MTAHNDFNDDNDDVTTPPVGADATGADHQEGSLNTGENTDTDDASGLDADGAEGANQGDATDNDTAVTGDPASDDDARAGKDDDSDADLPQLLREFSHVLRREFRSAAADSGFDPRDLGRLRRGRRRWDADEVVADGAAYPEEPVTYGPPRGRGGWGPSKNIDPEELRQRFRDMRDGVGDRIEEVLTSEEFENLKASLSKIVENFGPEDAETTRMATKDRMTADAPMMMTVTEAVLTVTRLTDPTEGAAIVTAAVQEAADDAGSAPTSVPDSVRADEDSTPSVGPMSAAAASRRSRRPSSGDSPRASNKDAIPDRAAHSTKLSLTQLRQSPRCSQRLL